jgi:hypothetical protein
MKPARQTEITAVDMVVRQVKPASSHGKRLTADSARVTDPVRSDGQFAGPHMTSVIQRGTRTASPSH